MRDYSQHGEQAAIVRWAAGRVGGFLDLGAYDGERYSNTAALAELGWPGVCVDAAPDAAGACAMRYADRDDVEVVLGVFDVVGGVVPALMHWSPSAMYSSLIPARRDDTALAPLFVPRLDLDWLAKRVAALPQPLFCSIDLEGGSIAALRWVIDHVDVACVCVEANNPQERATVAEELAGWRPLEVNAWNGVYALAEEDCS